MRGKKGNTIWWNLSNICFSYSDTTHRIHRIYKAISFWYKNEIMYECVIFFSKGCQHTSHRMDPAEKWKISTMFNSLPFMSQSQSDSFWKKKIGFKTATRRRTFAISHCTFRLCEDATTVTQWNWIEFRHRFVGYENWVVRANSISLSTFPPVPPHSSLSTERRWITQSTQQKKWRKTSSEYKSSVKRIENPQSFIEKSTTMAAQQQHWHHTQKNLHKDESERGQARISFEQQDEVMKRCCQTLDRSDEELPKLIAICIKSSPFASLLLVCFSCLSFIECPRKLFLMIFSSSLSVKAFPGRPIEISNRAKMENFLTLELKKGKNVFRNDLKWTSTFSPARQTLHFLWVHAGPFSVQEVEEKEEIFCELFSDNYFFSSCAARLKTFFYTLDWINHSEHSNSTENIDFSCHISSKNLQRSDDFQLVIPWRVSIPLPSSRMRRTWASAGSAKKRLGLEQSKRSEKFILIQEIKMKSSPRPHLVTAAEFWAFSPRHLAELCWHRASEMDRAARVP